MTVRAHHHPILLQINLLLVGLGLLFSLLIMVLHVELNFEREKVSRLRHIEETTRTRLPKLAEALWEVNAPQIQQELDAIAKQPAVFRVDLITPMGKARASGQSSPEKTRKSKTLSMDILHQQNPDPLGVLTLHAEELALWDFVSEQSWLVLSGPLLLLVLLILTLNIYLHQRLIVRTRLLTEHLKQLHPDILDNPPPSSCIRGTIMDEVGDLALAIQGMQQSLARDMAVRRDAEAAALEEQIRLEGEVARRAGEAIYISGFLNQLSRLSSDFLILPPARVDNALREALQEISVFLGLDTCFVIAMDDGDKAEIRSFWRKDTLPVAPLEVYLSRSRHDFSASFALLGKGKSAQVATAQLPAESAEAKLAQMLHLQSTTLIKLESPEQTIGLLCGGLVRTDRVLNDMERRLLCMTGNIVANLLLQRRQQLSLLLLEAQLRDSQRQLDRQSRLDSLTGLKNLRAFQEELPQELRRAQRNHAPLALLLIELKNDQDNEDILQTLTQEIKRLASRTGDMSANLGEGRFALLLPDTPKEGSYLVAQRLIQGLDNYQMANSASIPAQINAHIALLRLHPDVSINSEALMKLGEETLSQLQQDNNDNPIRIVDVQYQ